MSLNLIILIAVVAIFYFWYASIISKRNKVLDALSRIDVQLKNRLDLIPNILTIAKKFMEHEKGVFEEVTSLREQLGKNYDPKNPQDVSNHLASSEVLAQNMLHAQQIYNEVEAQIVAARRFYNSAVSALRNAIQIFTGNILAILIGVKEMPFFEGGEEVKAPVDAAKFL